MLSILARVNKNEVEKEGKENEEEEEQKESKTNIKRKSVIKVSF